MKITAADEGVRVQTKRSEFSWDWVNDKTHPIWGLAKLGLAISGLCLILAMNATTFDKGEIKTLVEMGAILFGLEGVNAKLRRGQG